MSNIQAQIAELEAKIRQLRSGQLTELKAKLEAARGTVRELEAQIAQITGDTSVQVEAVPSTRKRVASDELKAGVLKALAASPTGLSQKEIADNTGFRYPSVALFLKRNAGQFKTTGQGRGKRYFLR